ARSAVVWQSAEPASLRQDRPRQAVFTALAPFASPSPQHAVTQGLPSGNALLEAGEFVAAFKFHAKDNTPSQALLRKYLSAAARTPRCIPPGPRAASAPPFRPGPPSPPPAGAAPPPPTTPGNTNPRPRPRPPPQINSPFRPSRRPASTPSQITPSFCAEAPRH